MTTVDQMWEDAEKAEPFVEARNYFGQIQATVKQVVWRPEYRTQEQIDRGVKSAKVDYDETKHKPEEAITEVSLRLTPLSNSDGTPATYHIERLMPIRSREWAGIVNPSLRDINLPARSLNGSWVQVEMVANGRKYRDRETGEEKVGTTMKFVAVYPDEAATRQGSAAFYDSLQQNGSPAPAQAQPQTQAPAQPQNGSKDKEVALTFMTASWNQAAGSVDEFKRLIQQNPLIMRHFTLESPEVKALTGEA